MSQLRAPAARPERREGGRHGRPGARSLSAAARRTPPPPPDVRMRPQLLRTAVLPAIVAALSGAAAVVVVLRSAAAEPTAEIWTALVGTALVAFAAIGAAALGAERTAKSIVDRCEALRRSSARGQADLRTVVEQLRRGERLPERRTPPPPPAETPTGDELDVLAEELGRSHEAAVTAVVQASRLSSSVGNEQKVEVFVNLARRLQSLVHREIQLIDELENQVEDPELLKGIFHVDHLATRIRRHAENLAVLGGAVSRRQWSKPVIMTEVLRSAVAEVEQYPRIKLVPPIDGTLRGHAVADVIHLLAELVENATLFSSPHTQVLLRAQYVTAGLAIEVEDRGLGMPPGEQQRMNALLARPDQVNVAHLLQDGRIGLFVVSALARRHGIAVRLQSNIYGGVQAVLVLPQALLGSERTEPDGQPPAPAPTTAPTPGGAPTPGAMPAPGAVPAHGAVPAPGTTVVPVPRQYVSAPSQPLPPQPLSPQPPQTQPQRPQPQPVYEAPPGPAVAPGVPAEPGVPPVQGVSGAETAPAAPSAPAGPVPLPVRGAQTDRPTPAAARPGARHGHRRRPVAPVAPAAPPAVPPSPDPAVPSAEPAGDGTIRATRSRPQLPKRRGQEHLVPQLRDGPPPPPAAEPTLHDPGLMAAFRRGIGLAESQPVARSAEQPEPQRHDTTPKE
ncbi:ATP-binding protein [Streptomyces sp. NPDC088341]|uniref:sensor histidine kinase n=1 Tax=Streptomyces sp. NPDC088341 TaxID=3154870 RepID=UPI003432143A